MDTKYLQRMRLSTEIDKKVAWTDIKIGDITVKGITVWRGGNGRIRVFFPSHPIGRMWEESVELPPDLRSEIEEEIISAYRAERKKTADETVKPF